MSEQLPATNGQPQWMIDPDQLALIQRMYCRGPTAERETRAATTDEFAVFCGICGKLGLDPMARQICAQWRYDKHTREQKMIVVVEIAGYRAIAQRSNEYGGQVGPEWCGPDGQWLNVWTDRQPPHAARVGIKRKGWGEPLWHVAYWEAHYDPKSHFWKWPGLGCNQIAKCAEAGGLRRAYPERFEGTYIPEEIAHGTAGPTAADIERGAAPALPPPEPQAERHDRQREALLTILTGDAGPGEPLTAEDIAERWIAKGYLKKDARHCGCVDATYYNGAVGNPVDFLAAVRAFRDGGPLS